MIKNYLILFLSCLLFINDASFGQEGNHRCGTDDYYQQLLKENPALKKAEERADQHAEAFKQMQGKRPPEKQIIPVVFHVIHDNSSETNLPRRRILKALKRLNKDLNLRNEDTSRVRPIFEDRIADYNIDVRLARKDNLGNCFNGITRTERPKLTDNVLWLNEIPNYTDTVPYWNPDEYLNIWIVEDIYDNNPNSDIAGQANYPWSHNGADGIIMRADEMRFDDRTLTHEVGHYLGLQHPFHNGCSKDNDEVDDTPPVEDRDGIIDCNFNLNSCNDTVVNDSVYSQDYPDLVENYMDYTDCGIMFTEGQRIRSHSFLKRGSRKLNDLRLELVADSNLIKTGVKDTSQRVVLKDFSANKRFIYPCEPVRFDFEINRKCENGNLTGGTPNQVLWDLPGTEKGSANSFRPKADYQTNGSYPVKLNVTNQAGKTTLEKKDFIRVFDTNNVVEAPFILAFNEGKLFEKGIGTPMNTNGYGWDTTTDVAHTGDGSLWLNNYQVDSQQRIDFRLPKMDLANSSDTVLNFDLAYAQRDRRSLDKLEILISRDCGKTWELRKDFNILDLTSVSGFREDPFFPESTDDWQNLKVLLPAVDNLLVRFSWQSSIQPSNNVFIDNLNIDYSVGIEAPIAQKPFEVSVYPNPVQNGPIHIKAKGEFKEADLKVTNATGQVVYRGAISGSFKNNGTDFSKQALNLTKKGVYFFHFSTDKRETLKKIIILE